MIHFWWRSEQKCCSGKDPKSATLLPKCRHPPPTILYPPKKIRHLIQSPNLQNKFVSDIEHLENIIIATWIADKSVGRICGPPLKNVRGGGAATPATPLGIWASECLLFLSLSPLPLSFALSPSVSPSFSNNSLSLHPLSPSPPSLSALRFSPSLMHLLTQSTSSLSPFFYPTAIILPQILTRQQI